MTLKKIFLAVLLTAPLFLPAVPDAKIGSRITHLPSPVYLDGSNHNLSEFLQKKYLVLWIWENNSSSLQEFARIISLAARYRDLVSFVGIGIGNPEKLRDLPGVKQLPFPVNVDKGRVKKLFFRQRDRVPLTLLLDKQGTLLWRGSLRSLPGVLLRCENGKFKLNEQIRLENFHIALQQAMDKKDHTRALELLQAEYRRYPGRSSLLTAQITLLKKLDRRQEIFPILHAAQKASPANHRLFEMEYHLIGEFADDRRRPEFFSRLKKNFTARPEVLLGVAIAELQIPPAYLDLANVLDLAAAGWASPALAAPVRRGAYAMEYAKILHTIGRNDLAKAMAEKACKDLEKSPDLRAKAEAALIYYTKMQQIAPSVKSPDLKK